MQTIGIDAGFHKLMLEKKQIIFADEFCTEESCMRDYGSSRPLTNRGSL